MSKSAVRLLRSKVKRRADSYSQRAVEVKHADNALTFGPRDGADGWAQAGTARALLNSMVIGVTERLH